MSASRSGRVTMAVLVAILAVAGLLRLVGIDHGLPHVVGVDEGFEVHRALRLGAGEFDFDRDGKGGFFYLLFVEYGLYFVWLLVTGRIAGPTDFARLFATDLTPFWMIGRVTHALAAVATVYWVFRYGRRAHGARVGLFGAAVLAVSTLHVARSHYIGVDIPMTLLLVVLLELLLIWTDREREPPALLTGITLGATVMTKIVAIVAVVPTAVANWIRFRGQGWRRQLFGRKIWIAYLTAAVVFMVGNPGFVLNLAEFLREAVAIVFGIGADDQSPVTAVAATPNLWLYYLKILARDLGPSLPGLAAAGLFFGLIRRRPSDLLLLSTFASFYLLMAGSQTTHLFYPRYAIPLLVPIALLTGRLLDRVVEALPWSSRARGLAMAGAAALLLLPMAATATRWTAGQTRQDSRVATRAWFEAHGRSGAAVFLVGNPLVDTAPNLSLPLRNTDANLDALASELRSTEPAKAQILEWRKETGGRPFDLRTVRHFEPNLTLDDYLAQGVRYLVLDSLHFGKARLARDRKHDSEVLESRRTLARACRSDPRLELVYTADADSGEFAGPTVEVFRLRENGG